ncbi:hypothetical protein [Bacillus sp. J33]|uniref:hypothetical protein n=1 Tax=Bacillus sp. J33 TaxID=935836 RepID=UPI00047AE694|nr:hypothetical protein [Bacillus sp. J33]
MKDSEMIKEQSYIFTTSVIGGSSEEDFLVELFKFSPECPEMDCNGQPFKVLKGFDELINFIEEMDIH